MDQNRPMTVDKLHKSYSQSDHGLTGQSRSMEQTSQHHQLTTIIYSTLKMTSEQVVETSVTNKFSELLSRGRSYTIRAIDNPVFQPFTL